MGTLYIVATPIGNLEDISIRALRTFFSVGVIACEDTRRTGSLLSELRNRYSQIIDAVAVPQKDNRSGPKLIRYDDRTEQMITPEILDILLHGTSVALVSDAGTPLISDPGYILIREARKHGAVITSIPGASAVLTALTGAGLPANTFFYLGYPPEKQSNRRKLFASLRAVHTLIDTTYVLYCAPHKLAYTLEDVQQSLGDISLVVARELTKIHEQYWGGTVSEAINYFQNPKGEFVLLLHLSDAPVT